VGIFLPTNGPILESDQSAPNPNIVELTCVEVAILDIIKGQRDKTEEVEKCDGAKTVLSIRNRANIYRPQSFDEINPKVRAQIINSLKTSWSRRFGVLGRQRPYQVILNVQFPVGSPYSFRLIVDIQETGFEFVSPFKGFIQV